MIFFSGQNFVLKKKFIFVDQKILDHACFGLIFAGAARRAGPDSMLILCHFVSLR